MTYVPPQPDPSCKPRARQAENIREDAARLARKRPNRGTLRNGEAELYAPKWPTNFTKGLPHDRFGIVIKKAFEMFFEGLNAGPCSPAADFKVPIGPLRATRCYRPSKYGKEDGAVETFCLKDGEKSPEVRAWESPRAGHVYDLEGPDADALSMPPAPCLGSDELTAEMAEVYALALLRDVPFTKIVKGGGKSECKGSPVTPTAAEVIAQLNELVWFQRGAPLALRPQERRRREARFYETEQELTGDSVFRGSGPGAKKGPFLSQFLLIGSPLRANPSSTPGGAESMEASRGSEDEPVGPYQVPPASMRGYSGQIAGGGDGDGAESVAASAIPNRCMGAVSGLITYGTLSIDQRSVRHLECLDYMTSWEAWLDVQNGANLRGSDLFAVKPGTHELEARFLTTPRDLATYVHYDALYEAYLNACLLMASYGIPPSLGFPTGSFHPTRDSFATFGIPHVLSLVTEVATRGLKAVRRQKFNYHLRTRPEGIGGVLTLVGSTDAGQLGNAQAAAAKNRNELAATDILDWIRQHNGWQNTKDGERAWKVPAGGCKESEPPGNFDDVNALLPMAFPEGSPMHASYGAGHATVAGACVTILKAFFELYDVEGEPKNREDHPFTPVDFCDEKWWKTKRNFDTFDKAVLAEGESTCFEKLYVPTTDGSKLVPSDRTGDEGNCVTIIGELNKLAANISIGRNMAGVHFYTDYYDSVRLGERVAAGILQEQMLTYPEAMSMRFESFDGDQIVFQTRCKGKSGEVKLESYARLVGDTTGGKFTEKAFDEWWVRPSQDLPDACGDANPDEPCFGRCDD